MQIHIRYKVVTKSIIPPTLQTFMTNAFKFLLSTISSMQYYDVIKITDKNNKPSYTPFFLSLNDLEFLIFLNIVNFN